MDPIEEKISELFQAFEREDDPDLLYRALNDVEEVQRQVQPKDKDACRRGLSLLFTFLAAVDRHIDPAWDSSNVPLARVLPPEPYISTAGDGEIDPAEIADPDLRARYEQQLASNRAEVKRYRAQFGLRRVEERAVDDVKLLADACYAGSSSDRREFEALLDGASISDRRKKSLRKAVRWRVWPFGN